MNFKGHNNSNLGKKWLSVIVLIKESGAIFFFNAY